MSINMEDYTFEGSIWFSDYQPLTNTFIFVDDHGWRPITAHMSCLGLEDVIANGWLIQDRRAHGTWRFHEKKNGIWLVSPVFTPPA